MIPDEGDVERMLLDAEIHVAAAGIVAWLPGSFMAVNEAHAEEANRLLAAGDLTTAAVFADHGPMFEDGALCAKSGAAYPCSELRAAHSGEGVWDELVKTYPTGWEVNSECTEEPW